ncbi:MAG: hypothetical protein RTU30_07640 [Candidatus Thorarchaeota archaeon]
MTARKPMENLFGMEFDRPSDLLCCAFGLKSDEIDVYFSLLSGPKTVKMIARAMMPEVKTVKEDEDCFKSMRSKVQKALKKLLLSNLVVRETHYLERGGYFYTYQSVSSDEVREKMLGMLEEWYSRTRSFLLESWSAQTH